MTPKNIIQIWMGSLPPPQVVAWMQTIRDLNPEWEHTLWDDTRLREHGYYLDSMLKELGSWASVSNAIRLLLLNRFGGVYLDTDVECLKPLDELPQYGAWAALQDTDRICNAVMAAPVHHPWIRWQIGHFSDFDQRDPASGVYLASAAPREGLTLVDPHLVYPFSYDSPPEKRVAHPDSVLVHHWKGSWLPA